MGRCGEHAALLQRACRIGRWHQRPNARDGLHRKPSRHPEQGGETGKEERKASRLSPAAQPGFAPPCSEVAFRLDRLE